MDSGGGAFFRGVIDDVRLYEPGSGNFERSMFFSNALHIVGPDADGSAAHDYGPVAVGATKDAVFELAPLPTFGPPNRMVADYTIPNLAAALVGPDASQFSVNNPPLQSGSSTLQAGDGIVVRFAPTSAGRKQARVRITGTGISPYFLEVSGQTPSGSVAVFNGRSTQGIDQRNSGTGTVALGTVSQVATRTFTVRNTGPGDLAISSLDVSGTAVADLTVGALGATTLTPGARTTFDLTFRPLSNGARDGEVRIFTSDLAVVPFRIPVTASAQLPALTVDGPAGTRLYNDVLMSWGDPDYHAGEVPFPQGLTGVKSIEWLGACGLALKHDGSVVQWGSFDLPHPPAGLTDVATLGGFYSDLPYVIKTDGTVVSWGKPPLGLELTPPDEAFRPRAIHGDGIRSLAVVGGTVVAWGGEPGTWINDTSGQMPSNFVPSTLVDVMEAYPDGGNNLALRSDGSFFAWGLAGSSQYPQNIPSLAHLIPGFGLPIMALTKAGTVVKFNSGTVQTVPGISGLVALESSAGFSVGRKVDGTFVPFGDETGVAVLGPQPADFTETRDYRLVSGGLYAVFGIRKSTVDFGHQLVGPAGTPRSFTLRMSGPGALIVSDLTVQGANGSDFVVSGAPSVIPANGGTGTFTITFAPRAAGLRQGLLHVVSNDPGTPFDLEISGTGDPNETATGAPLISIENPAGTPISDGTVVAWGNSPNGQTSVPSGLVGVKAISAYFGCYAVRHDGSVVAWGGAPAPPAGLDGVKEVLDFKIALKEDGTVVNWVIFPRARGLGRRTKGSRGSPIRDCRERAWKSGLLGSR